MTHLTDVIEEEAMQRAYEAGREELFKELGIEPTKYAKWKKRNKQQLDSLTNHSELDQDKK